MSGMTSGVFGPRIAALACLLAACGGPGGGAAVAAEAAAAPAANPLTELVTLPYQPQSSTQGTIRLAGSTTLQQAAAHWAHGFQRIHPQVQCPIDAAGSEVGWQALLDGKADVALLSRPVSEGERKAWSQHRDGRLVVVVAGFERLVWIVHPSNPITALQWSPEGGILGAGPGGAPRKAAPAWSDLNGDAAWKDVPVRIHGRGLSSGSRWHMDRLLTGGRACDLAMVEHNNGTEIVEAVAADRGSLGLVGEEHAHRPDIKRLPLTVPADAVPGADDVVGSDRTPDCRPLFLAVAVPADGAMPPPLREFLEYVLSYAGQLDVAKDGLLPLSRGEIHAQKELLGWSVAR